MGLLTYQSTQTNSNATSQTSIVVTKPTGLAVGDLLVCRVAYGFGSGGVNFTITPSSGFTLLGDANFPLTGQGVLSAVYTKIADSGDVAASNFTWTTSLNTSNQIISMTRISNANSTQNLYTEVVGSGSAITIPTITPTYNVGIVMLFGCAANTTTFSGYSIENDNPSWTESYDISTSSLVSASMAYAFRTSSSSTGSANITISNSSSYVGQMVVINPNPVTELISETITGTENIERTIHSTYIDTPNVEEDYKTSNGRQWNKTNKPTTTWTKYNK